MTSSHLHRWLIGALGAVLVAASLSLAYGVFVPMGSKVQSILVHVPRGSSAYQIAATLKDAGLVRHVKHFQLLVGLLGTSKRLQAGEYELSPTMTVWDIVHTMRAGKVKLFPFVVVEGATIKEISERLERQGFGTAERFWGLTRREYLCQRMGTPINSLEGYLFPDTYLLSKDTSEFTILTKMLDRFSQMFDPSMDEKVKALKLTRHEVVTLASIIEWEAQVDRERQLVSSVFHNRLRRGQNLQSCATVLYAIGKKKRLFEKDLLIESIYNTYRHPGLPPTPICNPGKASMMAALEPAESPYFFFVSRGDGTHLFAKTSKEHSKNIKLAQTIRRERAKARFQ